MALQQFFPYNPNNNTWETFNGALIIFFGEEPIAYLPEEEWQTVAKGVAQLATFSAV